MSNRQIPNFSRFPLLFQKNQELFQISEIQRLFKADLEFKVGAGTLQFWKFWQTASAHCQNFHCPFIITYFLLLNSGNGNEVCIPARPRTCAPCFVRRLLQPDTPPFISPDMWPPNSPQLNPNLGSDAETRKNTGVRDTSDLKQRLSDTWTSVSQNIIHEVGDQWRKRLRACEKVTERTSHLPN